MISARSRGRSGGSPTASSGWSARSTPPPATWRQLADAIRGPGRCSPEGASGHPRRTSSGSPRARRWTRRRRCWSSSRLGPATSSCCSSSPSRPAPSRRRCAFTVGWWPRLRASDHARPARRAKCRAAKPWHSKPRLWRGRRSGEPALSWHPRRECHADRPPFRAARLPGEQRDRPRGRAGRQPVHHRVGAG